MFFVSCEMKDELLNKKPGQTTPGGAVSPDEIGLLDLQLEVKTPSLGSKAIDVMAPNVDDLQIKVFDANMEMQSYFENYATFKKQGPLSLPAGTYSVEAYSGDNYEATFSSPYYEMSGQYEVKKKEVTTVNGVCEMQSAIVSLVLSDDFLNACTDDYVIIVTNGAGVLTITKDEPKVVYLRSGFTISITIKATDKKTQTPVIKSFKLDNQSGSVSPQDIFTITIKDLEEDIIPEEPENPDPGPDPDPDPDPETPSGSGKFTIKVDVTLNEQPIDIIVPSNPDGGSETPEDPDGETSETPTITGDGIDTPATFKKGASGTVVVNIKAPNGLTNLNVRIDSPLLPPDELEGIGLKSEFDLANPGDLEDALKGLGFPTGNEVEGKTSVKFDISQFVPLLGALGTGTSKFHLAVTDSKGNTVNKTITIVITE